MIDRGPTDKRSDGNRDGTGVGDYDGTRRSLERRERRGGSHSNALAPSDALEAIADDRRRILLYVLAERGGTITFGEAARHIADCAEEAQGGVLALHSTRSVRDHLYHASIPKLADRGFVTYDRDAETVTLTAEGRRLEPYLEFAKAREPDAVRAVLE